MVQTKAMIVLYLAKHLSHYVFCFFQICLYLAKKVRAMNSSYVEDLQHNLVENVANVYGLRITVFFCVSGIGFFVHHKLAIGTNRTSEAHAVSVRDKFVIF